MLEHEQHAELLPGTVLEVASRLAAQRLGAFQATFGKPGAAQASAGESLRVSPDDAMHRSGVLVAAIAQQAGTALRLVATVALDADLRVDDDTVTYAPTYFHEQSRLSHVGLLLQIGHPPGRIRALAMLPVAGTFRKPILADQALAGFVLNRTGIPLLSRSATSMTAIGL